MSALTAPTTFSLLGRTSLVVLPGTFLAMHACAACLPRSLRSAGSLAPDEVENTRRRCGLPGSSSLLKEKS
jgi:hypothetical protein